jgi:hypothetical protein
MVGRTAGTSWLSGEAWVGSPLTVILRYPLPSAPRPRSVAQTNGRVAGSELTSASASTFPPCPVDPSGNRLQRLGGHSPPPPLPHASCRYPPARSTMDDLPRRAVSPSAALTSDLPGSTASISPGGPTDSQLPPHPTPMTAEVADDAGAEAARSHRAVSEDTEGHNCIICLQTIVDRTVIVRIPNR